MVLIVVNCSEESIKLDLPGWFLSILVLLKKGVMGIQGVTYRILSVAIINFDT